MSTCDPDALRLEILRLAAGPGGATADVLARAGAYAAWLAGPVRLVLNGPVIIGPGDPPRVTFATRTGASMAATMSDTDKAAYTVSEADSKGFPVTDPITWTESSAGAVVSTDGTSGIFTAVAPGTATITATDGTLTASDLVTVTAGAAATLVLGTPVVTPQAAPPQA